MADQAFVIYRMVVQAAAATPRVVPLRDFTHDLEAMAEAVDAAHAARLPRQPEQPDRHDLPPRRVGGLPRARCRRAS